MTEDQKREILDRLYTLPGEADFMDTWETSQLVSRMKRDMVVINSGVILGHVFATGAPNSNVTQHKISRVFLDILNAGHRDLIILAAKTKKDLLS